MGSYYVAMNVHRKWLVLKSRLLVTKAGNRKCLIGQQDGRVVKAQVSRVLRTKFRPDHDGVENLMTRKSIREG